VKAVICEDVWMSYNTFFGGSKLALKGVSLEIDDIVFELIRKSGLFLPN